jgi:hypothetical protein
MSCYLDHAAWPVFNPQSLPNPSRSKASDTDRLVLDALACLSPAWAGQVGDYPLNLQLCSKARLVMIDRYHARTIRFRTNGAQEKSLAGT